MTDVTFDADPTVNTRVMPVSTEPAPNPTSEAAALLQTWADEAPQTLVSRKLVIDRLLDIRNVVSGPARSAVDAILTDIPGVTVVEGRWWTQQIETLDLTFEHSRRGATS